jgi:hypothetical protein
VLKRHHIDIALASACWLLAAVAVWLSASGCEQVSMVFWSILFSIPVVVVGSVFVGWRRHTGRSIFSAVISSLACLAFIASIAAWQWPLRVSYGWSRAAFDSLAKRVRAGHEFELPQQVGLLTIHKVGVSYNGIVCLWTIPKRGGNTGFVQCGRDYVPFNLWSLVKLDDHWQFITED